jgi:hypothetical protein
MLTAASVSIGKQHLAADPASTESLGEPGSARASSLRSAASQLFAAAQESPKPVLNEHDILQNLTSKFDLGPQCIGITQQDGCLCKAAKVGVKTTERDFYRTHFYSLLPLYFKNSRNADPNKPLFDRDNRSS